MQYGVNFQEEIKVSARAGDALAMRCLCHKAQTTYLAS